MDKFDLIVGALMGALIAAGVCGVMWTSSNLEDKRSECTAKGGVPIVTYGPRVTCYARGVVVQ